MLKRICDIAGASCALLVLSPVLGLTALGVRRYLGSPVLFRQIRPGRHGKPFVILKFRTMKDVTDQFGHPLSDDFRLTPFGKWLRSTSLDELPELWNVLKGEMSLVGPRPLLMDYLPLYSARQARRHDVRPGVTGWAQINGRNAIGWTEKFELDVWYVEHQSLRLDLKIIGLTVWNVLTRRGITAPGEATMPRFLGSAEEPFPGTDA